MHASSPSRALADLNVWESQEWAVSDEAQDAKQKFNL